MAVRKLLLQLADAQGGYFSAAQAVQAGYPKSLQQYHTKSGNWLKIDRGIFRLRGYADTAESAFARWSLWAAGRSHDRIVVVSHDSALHYYGLLPTPPQSVHLSVSTAKKTELADGCRLYWEAIAADDQVARPGFRITTPARTLRDLRPDLTRAGVWTATLQQARTRGILSAADFSALSGSQPATPLPAPQGPADRMHDWQKEKPMFGMRPSLRIPGAGQREWSSPSRSFTLTELLVVIAIIGIVASLLMPSLMKAQQMAVMTSCASNLKQMTLSQLEYAGEYRRLPKLTGSASGLNIGWSHVMAPYTTNEPRFTTGSNSIFLWNSSESTAADRFGQQSVFTCPAARNAGTPSLRSPTYSRNFDLYMPGENSWYGSPILSRASTPGRTFLLADARRSFYATYTVAPPHITSDYMQSMLSPHQDDLINLSFIDGHVEGGNKDLYALSDLWTFIR